MGFSTRQMSKQLDTILLLANELRPQMEGLLETIRFLLLSNTGLKPVAFFFILSPFIVMIKLVVLQYSDPMCASDYNHIYCSSAGRVGSKPVGIWCGGFVCIQIPKLAWIKKRMTKNH